MTENERAGSKRELDDRSDGDDSPVDQEEQEHEPPKKPDIKKNGRPDLNGRKMRLVRAISDRKLRGKSSVQQQQASRLHFRTGVYLLPVL
ncbi:hypothetical protein RUM43_009338 [Polyplax serrata]|uniref:Uncharacterized protein n=1 Tax=Polyplax serrata TaxID=468196 RepID=A0AAN8NQA7_POLSC